MIINATGRHVSTWLTHTQIREVSVVSRSRGDAIADYWNINDFEGDQLDELTALLRFNRAPTHPEIETRSRRIRDLIWAHPAELEAGAQFKAACDRYYASGACPHCAQFDHRRATLPSPKTYATFVAISGPDFMVADLATALRSRSGGRRGLLVPIFFVDDGALGAWVSTDRWRAPPEPALPLDELGRV